ncbi:response regulator transcription factor [Croceicoccus hydrothermalis]|uniref:response regulator transcription factor n=1 Tax=Croceicoccus hydrothermalis TaxID=2867964 RepID=UPI001EFA6EB9|nr:response regulator [Croceicoccus hydrothermalis]
MARIILAEDDEIVGEIVRDTLMDAGHAVGWCKDGRSALDAIRFRPPHLAILDQRMPEMSGIEVLRSMRISKELAMVPVLMLTAVRTDADQSIAYYDGADDYITKPCNMEQLLFRADRLIKGAMRRTSGMEGMPQLSKMVSRPV